MIKVGSFFSINFYIYKMLIHKTGCFFIFKTFFFHYMTPMAGGVTYTDQNRLIFFSCFIQCLITPGKPVYGIMRMLKQVRTCFIYKFICELMHELNCM